MYEGQPSVPKLLILKMLKFLYCIRASRASHLCRVKEPHSLREDLI